MMMMSCRSNSESVVVKTSCIEVMSADTRLFKSPTRRVSKNPIGMLTMASKASLRIANIMSSVILAKSTTRVKLSKAWTPSTIRINQPISVKSFRSNGKNAKDASGAASVAPSLMLEAVPTPPN